MAVTPRPNDLPNTVSWVMCGVLVVTAAICLWLEPIHHDGWYFWTAQQSETFSFWDTFKANYLVGNPRFGEVITIYLYSLGRERVVVSMLLVVGAVWILAACALGRRPGRHDGLLVATLVAALLVAVPRVGPMHFYRPFFGNYVVGAMPSFALLAMWRAYGGTSWSPPVWTMPGLVVLSVIAGLGNEHTGPVFIALGVGACVWSWRQQRLAGWMVITVAALILGYLLLYFAPGQMHRYEGAGRSGPVQTLLSRSVAENVVLALRGVNPVVLLTPWFIVLVGSQRRRLFARDVLALEKMFFVIAVGSALAAATLLLASPKTGPRLYYAGAAMLSAATAALVVAGAHGRWRSAVAGLNALVVVISAIGLVHTNRLAHDAYAQRMAQIVGAPRHSTVVLRPIALGPRHWVTNDDLVSDSHLRQRLIEHFQLAALRVEGDAR